MAATRVAILASGSGSTAESFIKSCLHGEVEAQVILVISNNLEAGVFDRVKKINRDFDTTIQTLHIGKTNYPPEKGEKVDYGRQTRAEEKAILTTLQNNNIELIALMGYMKLVGASIVDKYGWSKSFKSVYQSRMINNHPGLLPSTKGLHGIHVQEHVLQNNLPAGHCIFAVDSEYDDGPIISEHTVQVLPDDTPEELFEKVKESEKKYLASDIQSFISQQKEYNQKNG